MFFGKSRAPENLQERRSRPHRHLGYPSNADGFVAMTTTLHYGPMEVRAFASHAVVRSAVSEVKPLTVAVLSTPKISCRAFCARH
jgi:hypothetical protein